MESRVRSAALVVLSGITISLLAACGSGNLDQSPPVAKVGEEALTERDLAVMLGGLSTEQASPEERWTAAERWVNRELLYREAVRRGILLDPEVETQVKTAEREIVINALLEQAFHRELAVSEDEIQQYYDDHRALFRRLETTIHVREIVLDGNTEARAVYRQLSRAPDEFEEIARRQSTDPSASDGGDLGYVSAATAYNQEIWQALQRLSEGEISRPISTDAGWSILQLVEKRPEGSIKTLEEVRLEIINRIRSTKRWSMITELVERLKLQEPYVFYAERLGPRDLQYEGLGDTLSVLEDIEAHE